MNEEERKALSINHELSEIDLNENTADRAAIVLKAGLGIVPGVGSILQEAISVLIPNQRMDRVIATLGLFAQQIGHLEEDFLRQKISSEKFTELLQDALPQAARAVSEERREYIASFLKNSLTSKEFDLIQEKKIISLLGELNDAEVIFLRYESLRPHERTAFMECHRQVMESVKAAIGSPREAHDKRALRASFIAKLHELGLLKRQFAKPGAGKMPELDETTGTLKTQSVSVSQLGKLLLRYIDQPSSSDRSQDEFNDQKRQTENSGIG